MTKPNAKLSSAARQAEHIRRINEMVEYLQITPVEDQPHDRLIYTEFDSSAIGLERARYVIKHNVTAEEAVRISNQERQAKEGSLAFECMSGKCGLSLDWLTRSFKGAA